MCSALAEEHLMLRGFDKKKKNDSEMTSFNSSIFDDLKELLLQFNCQQHTLQSECYVYCFRGQHAVFKECHTLQGICETYMWLHHSKEIYPFTQSG